MRILKGFMMNVAGGFNPPPTNVADSVVFGVCRPNLLGPQWETRRLQSAGGLQWVQEKLDWYERTKAYSAFVRSDQSAIVASECAGEGFHRRRQAQVRGWPEGL